MAKLEFKSKSLDFDINNNKKTHVILTDSNGSTVHIFLEESAIDLPNADLYKLSMQQHYENNFPGKAEEEKFDEVKARFESLGVVMDVLLSLAISTKEGLPIPTYKKVASVVKPLIPDKRYTNGDIISMPYPYNTNAKWSLNTPTIFVFNIPTNDGYTYKNQTVAEMLQKGALNVVMPRIE